MKKYKIIWFVLMLLLAFGILSIFSCKKEKIETGIKGNVEYGEGDCMPIVDRSNRIYDKYNGKLFFIIKKDLDNLGSGDLEQLKEKSISTIVKRGKLSLDLIPNTYVVMPPSVYSYSTENTISINAGEVLNKDFKFWKCTSY